MTPLGDALETLPVIGILRGCPPQHAEALAAAAVESGLTALEVTQDSPEPVAVMKAIAARHPQVAVGAGTVLTRSQAQAVAASGAAFLVSPAIIPEVIAVASEWELDMVPGAATPTEVRRALDLGASLVKLFPAAPLGGPAYVSAILAPLGRPRLVPTGGVGPGNAAAFLDAGAAALGVGGAIFPKSALAVGNAAEVAARCRSLVAALR